MPRAPEPRQPVPRSDDTELGTALDLTAPERHWFPHRVVGEPLTGPRDHTFVSMDVAAGYTAAGVVAD